MALLIFFTCFLLTILSSSLEQILGISSLGALVCFEAVLDLRVNLLNSKLVLVGLVPSVVDLVSLGMQGSILAYHWVLPSN